MRLINTHNLQFKEFSGEVDVAYAILSRKLYRKAVLSVRQQVGPTSCTESRSVAMGKREWIAEIGEPGGTARGA